MALSLSNHRVSRVLNSTTTGRRLVLRAIACQMAAVALAALVFLVQGLSAAIAAFLGGTSVVLGSALAANIALGGGALAARPAFLRLVLGSGLKWLVVATIFAMALGVGRLPPLPMLAGLAIALIAYPLALNFGIRVERER